jgi:intracellular multiplication protein IcmG
VAPAATTSVPSISTTVVQSNQGTAATAQPSSTTPTVVAPGTSANSSNMDLMINAMAAENEKLVNQVRADYAQKLSDYAIQNKALQTEIQTLNTRVVNLESQLSQLVQALTKPTQGGSNVASAPAVAPSQQESAAKIAYNVQAIIPGRAWLKTDSGETITVTEGDLVKGLGRVVKVDPYNGVVEINTGNKVISLSYGDNS